MKQMTLAQITKLAEKNSRRAAQEDARTATGGCMVLDEGRMPDIGRIFRDRKADANERLHRAVSSVDMLGIGEAIRGGADTCSVVGRRSLQDRVSELKANLRNRRSRISAEAYENGNMRVSLIEKMLFGSSPNR